MKWIDTNPVLTLVTAPSVEPLTYAKVKARLRLPSDDDEAVILDLIKAAKTTVEQDTGLMLLTQTWDLVFDAFPSDAIRPPCCPLQSVTSIKTTSVAGVESTLGSTNYRVDVASWPPRIVLSDTGAWPTDLRSTQAVTIRCIAGYTSPGQVPAPLIEAMHYLIEANYKLRSGMAWIAPPKWVGYDRLLAPYRLGGMA